MNNWLWNYMMLITWISFFDVAVLKVINEISVGIIFCICVVWTLKNIWKNTGSEENPFWNLTLKQSWNNIEIHVWINVDNLTSKQRCHFNVDSICKINGYFNVISTYKFNIVSTWLQRLLPAGSVKVGIWCKLTSSCILRAELRIVEVNASFCLFVENREYFGLVNI